MNWYKIAQFNPRSEASRLGISYDGPMKHQNAIVGYMFTDNVTRSSFMVKSNQNVQQKLNALRQKFK